jgi:hypothetical protein
MAIAVLLAFISPAVEHVHTPSREMGRQAPRSSSSPRWKVHSVRSMLLVQISGRGVSEDEVRETPQIWRLALLRFPCLSSLSSLLSPVSSLISVCTRDHVPPSFILILTIASNTGG